MTNSADTPGSRLTTRETVFRLTPASAATSRMVGRGRCRLGPLAGELGLDNVVITKTEYCIFRVDKKGEAH